MELIGRPQSKMRRCRHGRRRRCMSTKVVRGAAAFSAVLVGAFGPSQSQSQTAAVGQPALLGPGLLADPRDPPRFRDVDVEQAIADANRFRADATGGGSVSPGDAPSGTVRRKSSRRAGRRAQVAEPIPPQEDPPPEEDPPAPEADAYAPTGIKAGKFLLKPALEVTTGYDSNPTRLPGAKGSAVIIAAPELAVRSQFDRHELNADLRAAYVEATAVPAARQPAVDARVYGRYDVSDQTAINGEARYNLDVGVPTILGVVGQAGRLPLVNAFGATAGVTNRLDPVEISFRASLDRVVFQDTPLAGGLAIANQDRNLIQYGAQTRVTYALTPQFRPFISAGVDRRAHDQPSDFNGFRRDSTGIAVEVGAAVALPGKLAGEAAVGYLTRKTADPLLPSLGGFIADASLAYLPTPDTTVLFVAKSQAIESAAPGNSGVLRRDAMVEVDQQFGLQLTGMLRAGYGRDLFAGIARANNRYFVGVGIVYKVSRVLQLRADIQQEWLRSNVPINNVTATVATVGARVQY
jgi:hypothetical protein